MKKTALYERLLSLGGRFTEFGGYLMPMQFDKGILGEHKAVRESVGVFDVSHMGEFIIEGLAATQEINRLFTNNFDDMSDGKIRYTLMCNLDGGVLDDLLIYKLSDYKYYLVVNAANVQKDYEHIAANISGAELIDVSDKTSMVAVQGPNADSLAKKLFKNLPQKFYTFLFEEFEGHEVLISRTGYTGEDGFEMYIQNSAVVSLLDAVMEAGADKGVTLCGLGARDTLRLESAMPLFGHEMNDNILATEIGLDRHVRLEKHFIGRDALVEKAPKFKRVGLKVIDRGIAREGAAVFAEGTQIGVITSGTTAPTLGYPIAMARVRVDAELKDMTVDVRGRMLRVEEVAMPFYRRQP